MLLLLLLHERVVETFICVVIHTRLLHHANTRLRRLLLLMLLGRVVTSGRINIHVRCIVACCTVIHTDKSVGAAQIAGAIRLACAACGTSTDAVTACVSVRSTPGRPNTEANKRSGCIGVNGTQSMGRLSCGVRNMLLARLIVCVPRVLLILIEVLRCLGLRLSLGVNR